jgi:hypothetical protein
MDGVREARLAGGRVATPASISDFTGNMIELGDPAPTPIQIYNAGATLFHITPSVPQMTWGS